jgi:hypothetical protein
VRPLLANSHYLGPATRSVRCFAGWVDDELVAAQVFASPTSRFLGPDVLELTRWCLTAMAGENAGSRMMRWTATWLRAHHCKNHPGVTSLVSYSDLSRHSGALYKASGWEPWPTHHSERFAADGIGYPSGHGSWDGVTVQAPKMRWRFRLKKQTDG